MAKKKTKAIHRLKDRELPAVIQAAYDIGRFDGRCENIDAVRKDMVSAKVGLHAMAQEVKHLDALDRGEISIFIDKNTARHALAAMRKSKSAAVKQHAKILANKLKHAMGKL